MLPITVKPNDEKESSNVKIKSRSKQILILMYCFFGLQFSYLTWGILQEKVMTTEYEMSDNYFSSINENADQFLHLKKQTSIFINNINNINNVNNYFSFL